MQFHERFSARMARRSFLWRWVTAPFAFVLAACGGQSVQEQGQTSGQTPAPSSQAGVQGTTLPSTPACGDDDDDVTPSQTEGPYYKPATPERASLRETGMSGVPLLVTGQVLSTSCQPVARALLDFWHADDSGAYDNTGFRLRGHQFTDSQGRFSLETILPGVYPGRTRHIHVKVQAPNQPVLTTQLYFPDEPGNASDRIFNQQLVMNVQNGSNGKEATFQFVLDL